MLGMIRNRSALFLAVASLAVTAMACSPHQQGGAEVATIRQALALPSHQDVGSVGPAGTYAEASGVHTIEGGGADIWNTTDAFHYAYQTVTGDVTITARVTSLENTNPWAKAGVMMREGTAADARNVFTLLSPTPSNGYRMQVRGTAGGSTSTLKVGTSAMNTWLRITRVGNVFTSYYSTTGVEPYTAMASVALSLPATITVGLAVTAHVNPPTTLATGVFDNVSIITPPPAKPTGLVALGRDAEVLLSWDFATDVSVGYNIKRAEALNGPYTTIDSMVGRNEYSDTTVTNGTTYYYKVSGVNASGEGPDSDPASATPQPAPEAPTGLVAQGNDSEVLLSWDEGVGVTGYNIKRSLTTGGPYETIDSNIDRNDYSDINVTNGTTYYYVVSALNGTSEGPNSAEVSALPNWSSLDVGAVGVAGSFSQAGNNVTANGSGADIWTTADEFRYVFRTITGNATVTAKVTSLAALSGPTNAFAKAGVMMREGANPDARNVFASVTATASNQYRHQARTTVGGTTSKVQAGGGTIPVWLRVVRSGNTFNTFYSATGAAGSWVAMGTSTISMPSTILVGMAVTSHDDTALAAGAFENVAITQP